MPPRRNNPPQRKTFLDKLKKGFKNVADEITGGGAPLLPASVENPVKKAQDALLRGDHAALQTVLDEKPAILNDYAPNGETLLHSAVVKGDAVAVKFLLGKGADVAKKRRGDDGRGPYRAQTQGYEQFISSEAGGTPLFYAALAGRKEIAEMLLAKGAKPDAQSTSGATPLHAAAQRNDVEMLKILCEGKSKPRIDGTDGTGNTALHYAVAGDRKKAAEYLLQQGASTKPENNIHNSVLHVAARNGNKDMTELLLSHGADTKAVNGKGQSVLDLAIPQYSAHAGASLQGFYDAAVALIKSGADIDSQCRDKGLTALHKAAAGGHLPIVRALLDKGADPDICSDDGETALLKAVRAARGGYNSSTPKQDAAIDLLLHYGASCDVPDGKGMTPLMLACENGRGDLARKLLDYGADVNSRAYDGSTPLAGAVQSRSTSLVKLLLERGADEKTQKIPGETLIEFAKKRNAPPEMITLLREYPKHRRKLSKDFGAQRRQNRDTAQKQNQQNIRQYTRRDPKDGGGQKP
ncbi:MAG: ankyrin repeat domain-containing protein [Pseudomonadota bacterium]|nr:MAG: ankyrin repeat domain-containing protein [Pseudomonadota bacterium]